MTEGNYDDELMKFLHPFEPGNFQGSITVKNKFADLIKKMKKSKHYY